MIVRARIVLPISQPPIPDGAVLISKNRIAKVGAWKDLKSLDSDVVDLSESIVLPGLINAHCHLDYTDMAGKIPPPKSFSAWVKSMLATKASWSRADYFQSWQTGAKMLLKTGTTTVVDIEAVPELLPEIWSSTPLRTFSLIELTNVRSGRNPAEILSDTTQKIESLRDAKCVAGISPHALYSTSPELMRRSAELARKKNWLISTHVAESEEEFEMFEQRRGALYDWLKTQRDVSDCGISPVQQLNRLGVLFENFLAVHANYISETDATLLGKKNCSVVHCPRSHEYFGHKKFPWKMLSDAGVNICLGTDSLASMSGSDAALELNLFSEMQSFSNANPKVSPKNILEMATINGARALGTEKQIGELTTGSLADLISIPLIKNSDPYETVVQNTAPISACMIEGIWCRCD